MELTTGGEDGGEPRMVSIGIVPVDVGGEIDVGVAADISGRGGIWTITGPNGSVSGGL